MHASQRPPALFTDLYELTMLDAYLGEQLTGRAVFTLFVRRLPAARNVLLACGLESVLGALASLAFTGDDIAYLRSQHLLSEDLLSWLRAFRFTGDVTAVPEGTPIFADEPILEIAAPIMEAQLVETLVMNLVHGPTVVASKAARVVAAARGRAVLDFGARRTHAIDAAVQASRAAYIAGVAATSNVLAGRAYGLPLSGTMAHSYVQAHASERDAFRAFARRFPGTTLLVDTYDTLQGVRHVIDVVRDSHGGIAVGAVRLDSGDLGALARDARQLLDDAGLRDVRIVASSGLDEHKIAALVDAGAPIDGFGVGTGMDVSSDAPSLDLVYKLVEYAGEGRVKLAAGKPVRPGAKQIFRESDDDGRDGRDVVGRAGEARAGRPLLRAVMRNGERVGAAPSLAAVRAYAAVEMARLPDRIRAIAPAVPPYPVDVSDALARHDADVRARLARG